MALNLTFSVEERNDNKRLIVTDTTGEYNAVTNEGGWDATGATNPNPADIDGTTHTLGLRVIITTSDGTSTTYDTIDLRSMFGPFYSLMNLVFTLDCSMLTNNGAPLGTNETEFPDGIYDVTYIYDELLGTVVSGNISLLIDGQVRNSVYQLLRKVPSIYYCEDCDTKYILDTIFSRAWLDSMYSSAYVAKTEELLSDLSTLQSLIINGSRYTWQ